jgi:hypothetical protein
MLLPCALLNAVLLRSVSRVLVSLVVLGLCLLRALSLSVLILSRLLGTLGLLCVLCLLMLCGPLLLPNALFRFGLIVLGFFLVRMAPVLVVLVMLRIHWCSDSDEQGQHSCADHSRYLHNEISSICWRVSTASFL